jgi:hypothetical protein
MRPTTRRSPNEARKIDHGSVKVKGKVAARRAQSVYKSIQNKCSEHVDVKYATCQRMLRDLL